MTVGYTRLSLDKYGDQLGVARQREDIIALAKSLRWPKVTEFYEDNDVSANTDRHRPRPEFERLLHDMLAGRVSYVLCYDQDRLSRDMRQLEDIVDAVEAGHVMPTSVNGDIDLLTDNGRMVARIKAAVARNEIEKQGRRIKRQKLQRAQRGMKNMGGLRTFGYQRGPQGFSVDPREAAVLVELFERRAAGESNVSLVKWLNAARVMTGAGNVGNWRHGTVVALLQRREYIGDVTLNGEVVGKANFAAIIDRKKFERANARSPTAPAAWRSVEESGLLTGLLICGLCGAKMKRGRGKTTHGCYACKSHRATQGGMMHLSVAADAAVLEAVWLKSGELSESVSVSQWLSAQAAAIDHEIDQAQRMYAARELTWTALDAVLQHLRKRLAEERSLSPVPFSDGVCAPEGWEAWDLHERRRWLAQLVGHILVDRPTRESRGQVDLARLTVHFRDGEVRNLAREQVLLVDVAQLAGCSAGNAARALHGTGEMTPETRARVHAAADELGYMLPSERRGKAPTLGPKKARLVDVATLAGCTAGTASRALRGIGKMTPETRDRVRAAAAELGYATS